MEQPINIEEWHTANLAAFAPPVCNKLMYRNQVSVMFVGGPNTREDFHLQEGAELFYQIKGNMRLPTIQQGKLKVVEINEGSVFLLPSRIPHSPQRPEKDSLGLVIERERVINEAEEIKEMDALRFYTDFSTCEKKLWERNFYCSDLGKDLVPVITEWKSSEEMKTRVPKADSIPEIPKIVENELVTVPDPFNLKEWVAQHRQELEILDSSLPLFPQEHPDTEISVRVHGPTGSQETWRSAAVDVETIILQLEGTMNLKVKSSVDSDACSAIELKSGCIFVIEKSAQYCIFQDSGSLSLVISQSPTAKPRS